MHELTYAREGVIDVANELLPLLDSHYSEVAMHQQAIPFCPDWSRYAAIEETGGFHLFTVRNRGLLIGYAAFFLTTHMHHENTLVAINDVVFIHPAWRRGLAAAGLVKYCEQALRDLGAAKITWHVKCAHDWSAVLRRRGYENEELVVSKIL